MHIILCRSLMKAQDSVLFRRLQVDNLWVSCDSAGGILWVVAQVRAMLRWQAARTRNGMKGRRKNLFRVSLTCKLAGQGVPSDNEAQHGDD